MMRGSRIKRGPGIDMRPNHRGVTPTEKGIMGCLRSQVRRNRDRPGSVKISLAALLSQILACLSVGGFAQPQRALRIVTNLQAGTVVIPQEIFSLLRTIFNYTRNCPKDLIDKLKSTIYSLPNRYEMAEFKEGGIDTVEAHDLHRGTDIFNSFLETNSTDVLYIDTESMLDQASEYDRTCLVSIFDAVTRTVLLWRLNKMAPADKQAVKDLILSAKTQRGLCYFDDESFLDLTRRGSETEFSLQERNQSLKDQAAPYCVINKSERLGDWAADDLRDDQKEYAAGDVLALYYIHTGQKRDWIIPTTTAPRFCKKGAMLREAKENLKKLKPYECLVHEPTRTVIEDPKIKRTIDVYWRNLYRPDRRDAYVGTALVGEDECCADALYPVDEMVIMWKRETEDYNRLRE